MDKIVEREGQSKGAYRVACDVGGTFTDLCFLEESSGTLHVSKTPTTANPIDGVVKGIGLGGIEVKDMVLFAHGTTLATNALITRRFPRAVMVTTKGFKDVIEIRRGTRNDLWDTYKEMAAPYIARRDRLVVSERIDYSGKVITEVDETEALEIAKIIGKRGVKTIAICFVNSFANPANEYRMRDLLLRELPDAAISISSDIMPEIFEHERFSTTVANTVLAPVTGDYSRDLAKRLADNGYKEDLLLLHSGGGVMTAKVSEKFSARLAGSGIAAGAIASRFVAQLSGFENSIGFDMGGTSTDVCLCDKGELPVTKDWHVEYGYPICFPSIEVLTIGAGGGSLAWIDKGGSLRNGPQSAGSRPGPVCYNQGGTEPTNSDANVMLGRLGTALAGGAITLHRDLAEKAIAERIAKPLGLTPEEAALSILKVANANMADAVRLVSIRKGYDPRDFALVAFGGAGALHGAALAKDLAIPTVLVPPNPGVTSALGCLLVDITHDISRMYLHNIANVSMAELDQAYRELELDGRERLLHEGVAEDRMVFQRFIDMRYLGQWRSMSIAVPSHLQTLDTAVAKFHEDHGREHNYSRPGAPVEVYRLQVKATGLVRKAEFAKVARRTGKPPAPEGERMVLFDENPKPLKARIFDRTVLMPGDVVEGPAIIEQLDSTTLVPPGIKAGVDDYLTIIMRVPIG
jgi:N-methylhydantoinase A